MHSRPSQLPPATAQTRRAIRVALESAGIQPGEQVFVALSGGGDSLALAAGLAFEAQKAQIKAGAVIVDHGLQAGSAEVAAQAADQARTLGLSPVIIRAVTVGDAGGPENAAREARYAAIREVAQEHQAQRVLLGHTLDDQAETVLLGLSRGSGAGSLQGMASDTGLFLRPLLGLRRSDTRQVCREAGLTPWEDPHNTDPGYTRVRVRERVLPVLEAELGPGVAEALARTAAQAREDQEAFAEMIDEFIEEIVRPGEAGIEISVAALEANPAALRQRIIRYVALAEFGVTLSREHTLQVAALVTDWRGQGPAHLPGIRVKRAGGWLLLSAATSAADSH